MQGLKSDHLTLKNFGLELVLNNMTGVDKNQYYVHFEIFDNFQPLKLGWRHLQTTQIIYYSYQNESFNQCYNKKGQWSDICLT